MGLLETILLKVYRVFKRLFEARNPKGQAVITEIEGKLLQLMKFVKDQHEIIVQGEVETRTYTAPYTARLKVTVDDQVVAGEELTEGSIDPKELLRVKDVDAVQEYLLTRSTKSIPYARGRNRR